MQICINRQIVEIGVENERKNAIVIERLSKIVIM